MHFTTIKGIVGILASGYVKSRERLPSDSYLEHVYKPNAVDRSRDRVWHDYVNLSVSQINDWMFGSSYQWHVHEEVSWLVLSFSPDILGDPGVVFTTTNNIYPKVRRGEGLQGFNDMFADHVFGRYGASHRRDVGHPDTHPTHRQAEVLYPGQLSLDCLVRIDAQVEEGVDHAEGALGVFDLGVEVRLAPEVFL